MLSSPLPSSALLTISSPQQFLTCLCMLLVEFRSLLLRNCLTIWGLTPFPLQRFAAQINSWQGIRIRVPGGFYVPVSNTSNGKISRKYHAHVVAKERVNSIHRFCHALNHWQMLHFRRVAQKVCYKQKLRQNRADLHLCVDRTLFPRRMYSGR